MVLGGASAIASSDPIDDHIIGVGDAFGYPGRRCQTHTETSFLFGSKKQEETPSGTSAIAESAANWSRHAALLSSQSAQAAAWASKTANEATAAARNAVAQMVYLSDSLSNSPINAVASSQGMDQIVGSLGAVVTSASWNELRSLRTTLVTPTAKWRYAEPDSRD
eukprot:CAMPEP_0169305262 /NCGR_PEP_ID=MMETSP1017-20121227/16_1 /TAXON_ID=342587 /ORGANISM="Karlodinium micrum, Strain CCMP2283" /LENGTH=164 /DNA_ID=CAMNT_0009398173 /DNA_START=25 /DNA_END=516 /DNA_ORIENTATION=-